MSKTLKEMEEENKEIVMKKLMIQGTSSSAGKTTIVAGLCRVLAKSGKKVCPFKSQNMALNSYVDEEGREVSRATALQAEAAMTKVKVSMNPILLKANRDDESQVLVEGVPFSTLKAKEYFSMSSQFKKIAKKNFEALAKEYDYCILEGGGSPAEINLRQYDYVNMGMAEMIDAPVVLVGNIEIGGVFASLYGTVMLLDEEDRKRIQGIIINKFRGDIDLLKPGIAMLEERLAKEGYSIPVLGVLPCMDIALEEEDSLSSQFLQKKPEKEKIVISILKGKQMGNTTDFQPLLQYSDVLLRYVESPEELGEEDLIILAGSKNTLEEVEYFRSKGFDKKLQEMHGKGISILGICGGFQALGDQITDPLHIDGNLEKVEGFHLFSMTSTMEEEKVKRQVRQKINMEEGLLKGCLGMEVEGYEIHHGRSSILSPIYGKDEVYGTYIHGIFENGEFTRVFLNNLRKRKKYRTEEKAKDYRKFKDLQYETLAKNIEKHINMEKLYQIFR
ncbi:cobyric acid synthase CobQ [Fusobacterium necrophorum subsp. funduliforme ATCC 51357]|nr:cobyric acid synthase CobQ [Fusobacterium necrophorum subsp. funduliforme ATCC 51357]